MVNTKLRLYSFTNFYLNTISQGIQTAHVIARMAHFYRHSSSPQAKLFWAWCDESSGTNETIICLNGGMAADIAEAYQKFEPILHEHEIPSMIFYEEPRAFGLGTCERSQFPTSWACVLPEELYDAQIPELDLAEFAQPELLEFLQYKNRCPLAR